MSIYTRVPEVMDALLAMFTAALPADGSVAIIDGPPVGENTPDSYVAIGYGPAFAGAAFTGTTGRAIQGQQEVLSAGNRQRSETYDIQCEAATWTGDSDPASMSRMRIAARALFNLCAAALATDPTVSGTVTAPGYASVAAMTWLADQSSSGCSVSILFTVEVIDQWLPV